MSNPFDEIRAAVEQAKTQLRAADVVAESMGSLLRGRLRQIDNHYVLAALKKELAGYSTRSRQWREKQ